MHKKLGVALFIILAAGLVLTIGVHNFIRYYVNKDYPLHVFSACNPLMHSCFVADPATADPTFQPGPYEKIMITAAVAPSCLDEHTCSNFTCDAIAQGCAVTYCSDATKEAGESCSSQTQ